jgi:prolyl oligopeptidase
LGEGGIRGKLDLVPIVEGAFEADYDYITNVGSLAVFQTNRNAKNFKLIQIDLEKPSEANWVDLVAEQERDVLDWAAGVAGDKLVTCYMQDVKNVLQLRDLKTGDLLHTFKLDIGCVAGFSGHLKHKELFFKFSSQITPGTIYHVDLSSSSQPVPKVHITTRVHNFNPADFSVKQVFYPSRDGTQIPMFVIARKDFVADASSPCLLYGYGGFSHSLTPSFNLIHTFFVQHFGIAVVANIRGGGEYGEAWQNAGRQENLQNIFDDFQCAAEYLIRERYTTPDKLTINGGSHGGMLVGTCVNQRPDLYGAAVNVVGVMDLLRFHKFTVGYAWTSNYGCSDNEKDFRKENLFPPEMVVRRL